MKNSINICSICKKEITHKSDLNILNFIGLLTRTFCNDCYAKKDRGIRYNYWFGTQTHITSDSYKFKLILETIFAVFASMVVFGSNLFGNSRFIFIILVVALDLIMIRFWIQYWQIKTKISKLKD